MSYRIMRKVIGFNMRPTQKYILLVMADEADNEGCNIFMSVDEIAERTGLQPRTVQMCLANLKVLNILRVEDQAFHHTPPTYSINLSQLKSKRKAPATNEETNKYLELTWNAYPSVRRVSKPTTFKAILKAYKKISPDDLLQRVRDYANAMHRREQYAPHSHRWFEHERYLDDPATWNADKLK